MVTEPAVQKCDLAAARQAYLASGDEAALPVVDAHHHLWDPVGNPHPWLQRLPRIPFRYGDYGPICRPYGPSDHARDAAGHRVVRSVVMEGEWDPADPIGEARWLDGLATRTGTPHAVAAQAWLDRPDLSQVLAAYRAMPRVRSVRHKPRITTRQQHHEGWAVAGSMRCPRWRDGYARVAAAGLHFELQAPWWHLDEAVELARDLPGQTLVLNHAGLPAERDEASLAAWRRAVGRLADMPNVVVKLSGLGVPGQRWTAALQSPVVSTLLSAYGPSRCMFASNFPVDGLVATYDEVLGTLKQLTRHLEPHDRLQVFCDTAARVYRLD